MNPNECRDLYFSILICKRFAKMLGGELCWTWAYGNEACPMQSGSKEDELFMRYYIGKDR
jgi:hypothetical protein